MAILAVNLLCRLSLHTEALACFSGVSEDSFMQTLTSQVYIPRKFREITELVNDNLLEFKIVLPKLYR